MKFKLKPSHILKWLLGTKEGREYYRKEVNQWCDDIKKSMEKQLFGGGDNDKNKDIKI